MIAQGEALIEPSGCLQCHRKNEKLVGPSFIEIASKYTKTPENIAKLNRKVYEGGSGVWGTYAMAAQSHLQKPEIDKMVRWILSLSK
jgi:cytochrome c